MIAEKWKTDMNTNKNKKKYDAKAEETVIFRVIALIFVAMAGFGALTVLENYQAKLFSYVMKNGEPVFTVITLTIIISAVLACLSVAYYIYTKKKGTDESRRVVTSFGIMSAFVLVFVSLLLIRFLTNAMIKVQVLFFASVLLAFLYNICARSFFEFSLFSFVSGAALYYVGSTANYGLDKVLEIIAKIYVFAAPVAIIAFTILFSKKGGLKLFGKTVEKREDAKFYHIFWLIMAVLLLVFAVICMAVNFMAVYLIISFFVIYLALGIFCTIKMM